MVSDRNPSGVWEEGCSSFERQCMMVSIEILKYWYQYDHDGRNGPNNSSMGIDTTSLPQQAFHCQPGRSRSPSCEWYQTSIWLLRSRRDPSTFPGSLFSLGDV